MKPYDVKFTVNAGEHKGDDYGFTLAIINNMKAWQVTKIPSFPPDITTGKIEMVIAAREENIAMNGGLELEQANEIMKQLAIIAEEIEPVTLDGFDGEIYKVRVDRDGFILAPVSDEKAKEPEYQITLICWSTIDE